MSVSPTNLRFLAGKARELIERAEFEREAEMERQRVTKATRERLIQELRGQRSVRRHRVAAIVRTIRKSVALASYQGMNRCDVEVDVDISGNFLEVLRKLGFRVRKVTCSTREDAFADLTFLFARLRGALDEAIDAVADDRNFMLAEFDRFIDVVGSITSLDDLEIVSPALARRLDSLRFYRAGIRANIGRLQMELRAALEGGALSETERCSLDFEIVTLSRIADLAKTPLQCLYEALDALRCAVETKENPHETSDTPEEVHDDVQDDRSQWEHPLPIHPAEAARLTARVLLEIWWESHDWRLTEICNQISGSFASWMCCTQGQGLRTNMDSAMNARAIQGHFDLELSLTKLPCAPAR